MRSEPVRPCPFRRAGLRWVCWTPPVSILLSTNARAEAAGWPEERPSDEGRHLPSAIAEALLATARGDRHEETALVRRSPWIEPRVSRGSPNSIVRNEPCPSETPYARRPNTGLTRRRIWVMVSWFAAVAPISPAGVLCSGRRVLTRLVDDRLAATGAWCPRPCCKQS